MENSKIKKGFYLTPDIVEKMDTYTTLTNTSQSSFVEMVIDMFLRNLDRVKQGMIDKARKERENYHNQIKSLGL